MASFWHKHVTEAAPDAGLPKKCYKMPRLARLELKVLSRTCLVTGLLTAVLAPRAWPQDARGRILGLVTDSSGAVVPGAAVTAVQLEQNTTTPARTNTAGRYDLPFLLPGPYRLEVSAPGLKSFTRAPIEVRVGESATVDVLSGRTWFQNRISFC